MTLVTKGLPKSPADKAMEEVVKDNSDWLEPHVELASLYPSCIDPKTALRSVPSSISSPPLR